jgi:hypothetical protein
LYKRLFQIIAALFTIAMLIPLAAEAADFSAQLFLAQNDRPVHGRVYISGPKARVEIMSQHGPTATISRSDLKLTWVLYLKQRMYKELKGIVIGPLSGAASVRDPLLVTRTVLGKEMINKFLCDKIYYKFRDEKRGQIMEWYSPELGYPVKILYKGPDGGAATEFDKIKQGPQNQNLFEIPEGFTKLK